MNGHKPHILAVDDDDRLRQLLKRYLSDNGFLVTTAPNTKEAGALLELLQYDLLVLDIMMPGETGLAFARRLKAEGRQVPVLLLTAMGEAEDRIEGLEAGAEDYLAKPFEPRELLLRIKRIVDRRMETRRRQDLVVFGPYEFDLESGRLMKKKELIALTTTETLLLKLLARQPRQPLSRDELCRQTDTPPGNERTIDVQINRLRKKIEDVPGKPVYLQTVRSAGYAFFPD